MLNIALDTMSEKVLILDVSGRVVFVNQSWRAFLDSRTERIAGFGVGRDLRNLAVLRPAAEYADEFYLGLDDLLAGGSSEFACRYRASTVEGERWFQLHAMRMEAGTASRVIVALDDVSDVHRVRRVLHGLSLHLMNLQEQERKRIALELHDSTAQHLAAMSLNLTGLRQRLKLSGSAAQVFDDIERSLESTLQELRSTSFLLYPPHPDGDGVEHALKRFVQKFSRLTGMLVILRISRGGSVPLGQQQMLLRVVQEALMNVQRHAHASRVYIRLRITRRDVFLCVLDNGRGMDRTGRTKLSAVGTGIGISGMQARIEEFGGVFRLKSRPGQGTRVLAKVPLVTGTQRRTRAKRHNDRPMAFVRQIEQSTDWQA
jgi:signal transduction histidine kinase